MSIGSRIVNGMEGVVVVVGVVVCGRYGGRYDWCGGGDDGCGGGNGWNGGGGGSRNGPAACPSQELFRLDQQGLPFLRLSQ